MNETEKGNPGQIRNIVIGLVVICIIGGIYYFNNSKPQQDNSKNGASQEQEQNSNNGNQATEEYKNEIGNQQQTNISADASNLITSVTATMVIQPKQAADKAVDYVNKYVIQEGQEAKVTEILPEKFTFYKFFMDVQNQKYPVYVSTDGNTMLSVQEYDLNKNPNTIDGKEYISVGGGFEELQKVDICKENGKPIVYFFGSASCPHCQWEKPLVSAVASTFGDRISYHENIDNNKDTDILNKFSKEGGIPTIVIGCKYFKIGSGEGIGETIEKENIRKYILRVLN